MLFNARQANKDYNKHHNQLLSTMRLDNLLHSLHRTCGVCSAIIRIGISVNTCLRVYQSSRAYTRVGKRLNAKQGGGEGFVCVVSITY